MINYSSNIDVRTKYLYSPHQSNNTVPKRGGDILFVNI